MTTDQTENKKTETQKLAYVEDHIPASIKVIGVGGGGVNVILRMLANPVPGVDFIAINTDIKSLDRVRKAERILRVFRLVML